MNEVKNRKKEMTDLDKHGIQFLKGTCFNVS